MLMLTDSSALSAEYNDIISCIYPCCSGTLTVLVEARTNDRWQKKKRRQKLLNVWCTVEKS